MFNGAKAQELLNPTFTFSGSKPAYLTFTDGTKLEGTIKDIDRKKGLIKLIKIKDKEGNKHKIKPEQVQYMYLAPSSFSKLSKALNISSDVRKWTSKDINQDLVGDGYVYFEQSKVQVKKKQLVLLMQLLNPNFSAKVKVYHDPRASESTSLAVGGLKVAGGHAKSYYVKVEGQDVAYRLKKKDYKKGFAEMWKGCDKVAEKYPKIKWTELVKHIIDYTECK